MFSGRFLSNKWEGKLTYHTIAQSFWRYDRGEDVQLEQVSIFWMIDLCLTRLEKPFQMSWLDVTHPFQMAQIS